MSEIVSALPQAKSSGIVSVEEAGLAGMVTLRGDLESAAFQSAVKAVLEIDVPPLRRMTLNGVRAVLWMSHDELLLMCAHGEADHLVAKLEDALSDQHHLAVNVSDARAVFTITGDDGSIRDVLAKLTPADLRPESLPVHEVRRTRLAQVPAAIWFDGDGQASVVCFRSVAEYVFGLLDRSSRPGS